MTRLRLAFLLAALLASGTLPAVAQSASGATIDRVEVSGYPDVLMLATAPTEFLTTDLTADDWIVTEDGTEVSVDEVIRVGGEDIRVALVIDVSGSMAGEPLAEAIAAADSFIDAVPSGSELALVTFGDSATTVIGFTSDLAEIRDGLTGLQAGGETALYDGIIQATLLFPPDESRNSIVILTDGADTASVAPEAQAVNAMVRAGLTVFAIEYETSETASDPLLSLTEAAGGSVFQAGVADLGPVYQSIGARITSQYVLRYESTASGVVSLGVRVRQEGTVAPVTYPVRLPVLGTVSGPTASTVTTNPPVTTVPPTLPGAQPEVSSFGARSVIWYGLAAVFIAMLALLVFLLQPGREREKRTVRPSFRTSRQRAVGSTARGLVSLADRAVASQPRWGVQARLAKAGLSLRPGEYVVLTLIAGIFLFFLGWISRGPVFGLTFGLIGVIGGIVLLNWLGSRRQRRFETQLPEVLDMLASTIRTGYAPLQATELVSREVQDPAQTELARVVAEARLGRDYIDAMAATATRVQSEDLRWVVGALEINRDVGGDISELLETVSRTIRERVSLRRMVAALSAEGRLSAWILIVLPFFLVFFINSSNPGYLAPLFESAVGIGMLITAGISMILGAVVIRRIVNLEP